MNSLCRDIEDSNVSPVQTNFGEKLHAHQYIYMKSIRKMYASFIKSNNEYVSMSTFYRLKPFYVVPPTTHETESCGCIRCMNPHLIYNAIKRHANCADDFPNSLTEYLTQNFSCKKNASINYHDIKCINGSCPNQ